MIWDDGQKIFELIKKHLENNKSVELDYSGLDFITLSFQNVAIGQLYGVFSEEKIKLNLTVVNLSSQLPHG